MLIVRNLKKVYSNSRGLYELNVQLEPGTITAVIGPNGAGKSTFFNMMNGLVLPQSGECLLDGTNIYELPLDQTGFLPEANFLIDNFSVMQMIEYFVQMKSISVAKDRIHFLLDGFSMRDYQNEVIKRLSQGMRKRVAIICAILNVPKLLVLDEPLNALDIQSVVFLKKLLQEAKNKGSYILLSSHVLDFLDGLADNVVFLRDGKPVVQCSCTDVKIEDLYRNIYGIT